jgi:hypothetical protein
MFDQVPVMVDPAGSPFNPGVPQAIGLILLELERRLRKSHILRSLVALLSVCGL